MTTLKNLPPKPECGEFQIVYWNDDAQNWYIRDLTPEEWADKFPEPEPLPLPPLEEQIRAARAAAYTTEADPIFFQYQRGEATEQEWLDKVEAIRARYPYPDSPE